MRKMFIHLEMFYKFSFIFVHVANMLSDLMTTSEQNH